MEDIFLQCSTWRDEVMPPPHASLKVWSSNIVSLPLPGIKMEVRSHETDQYKPRTVSRQPVQLGHLKDKASYLLIRIIGEVYCAYIYYTAKKEIFLTGNLVLCWVVINQEMQLEKVILFQCKKMFQVLLWWFLIVII